MKIMATSFKKSHQALPHSVPPTLQPATADPCLRWRLLDTLGRSLMGPLLLSAGSWCTQGFVCALQETDPHLPGSVQESPAEAWVDRGLLLGQGH